MTNTENITPTAGKKKTSITKKIFVVIALVLGLLGIDHYTYNFAGIGASVTVTDSTLVVAPIVEADTAKNILPLDTAKKDTTKK